MGDSQSDRVRAGATVAVVPSWLSFKVRSHVLGSDRALEGSTQAWALVPGIAGDYFRRAFLGLVLARCDRTATIGYGTSFSKTRASIAERVVIGPHCNLGWVTSRMARSSGRVAICQAALALTGRVTPRCKCANRLAIWLK